MHRLIVELTSRCNLNCIWCGSNIGKENLSHEDACEAIRRFKPRIVSITGGEPLLRKDIFDFIDFCKETGSIVELCTNGTLITEDAAKKLNADWINISIDGLEDLHDKIRGRGSFRKTLVGLKNLDRAGKLSRVVLATVLGKINKDAPKEIIRFFYPNIKKFMFGRVIPLGKARPDMCLSFTEALKIWFSLQHYRLNPFLQIVFAVQFWQIPGPAFLGPVLRADKKIVHCCIRYNEVIGSLQETKKLRSTSCLFCKGCTKSLPP